MFERLSLPTIPDGTPAWWYVVAMSLAVLIMGISKAGFGGKVNLSCHAFQLKSLGRFS